MSLVDEAASGGTAADGAATEPLPAKAPGDYQPWPPCVVAGVDVPHKNAAVRFAYQPTVRAGPHALWCRVGGGGGHSLVVSDCCVRALVYRPPA